MNFDDEVRKEEERILKKEREDEERLKRVTENRALGKLRRYENGRKIHRKKSGK